MTKILIDEATVMLALEALKNWLEFDPENFGEVDNKAITALREALAEQPQESPKFDPNESFAREEAAQARVREFMRNH